MVMQDKIMIVMILTSIHIFNYAASDDATSEVNTLEMIPKTALEQELIDTGRYALFKMVHKLYNIVDPQAHLNGNLIPEFKKNAEPKLYLIFNDYYATSPSDICMLWGRICLSGKYTCEQKQKISFLVRKSLGAIYQDSFAEFRCYQVLKIEDEVIPKQIERACEKGRLIKDIKEEWNALSQIYKREQKHRMVESAHTII